MLAQRPFRDILGRFTTGVVLVTARTDEGPVGMAVNSFTSVSVSPPLIAVCAAATSITWPQIRAAGGFAVTILGDRHRDLCTRFSTRGADRFVGEWNTTPMGHPLAVDCLGWLDCVIDEIHEAGDHELAIARATDGAVTGQAGEARPLVFHAGRFTALSSERPLLPVGAYWERTATG